MRSDISSVQWTLSPWLGFFALVLGVWAVLFAMTAGLAGHGGAAALGPGMGWSGSLLATLSEQTGAGSLHLHSTHNSSRLLVAMWCLMSVAMMAPTAVPMLQAYHHMVQDNPDRIPQSGFWGLLGGYLAVWFLFSLVMAIAQLELGAVGLLTDLGVSATAGFSAALLGIAAAYQFSSLKQACLSRCLSPRPSCCPAGVRGLKGRCPWGCTWALSASAVVGPDRHSFGVATLANRTTIGCESRLESAPLRLQPVSSRLNQRFPSQKSKANPMSTPNLAISGRTRSTPYSARVTDAGVKAYTVYNHMLLPSVFRTLQEDYWHLKRHVQIWDVSCERQVEIQGPDATRLVQLMTPRDLSKAVPGRCLYVPLVDETGGMINDPVALKLADNRYWLSISDSDALLWSKGLAYGLGLDVSIQEPDVSPLAVQGPQSDELVARVFGEAARSIRFFRFAPLDFRGHPLIIARSGWSKQGGFEIYLDDSSLGLDLWDALWEAGQDLQVGPGCPNMIERIEGGLLSYGNDMTREHNPFECGLDVYCNLDRPIEFIGRDALQRVVDEGVRRHIVGLRITTHELPPCTAGWPVYAENTRIGQVTSAAISPDFGCGVALAMLERRYCAPGDSVEVETPDGPREATVSELPFARQTE